MKTADLTVEPSEVDIDDVNLDIMWKDGRRSRYDVSWIEQNYQLQDPASPRLWGKCDQTEVLQNSQVTWEEFMSSDAGVESLLSSIIK